MDRPGAQRTLSRGDELWRIERDGDVLRTARGRPGRRARTTVRVCSSAASAERSYARAIQTRLDRGWHLAAAPPGWPDAVHPPEATHDPLERRLRRVPWAPGLADAYATWLADQHDPRGALAALQHRSTPHTEAAARAARRFAWLLDRDRDPPPDPLPPAWWWRHPGPHPPASPPCDHSLARAEQDLLTRHRRHFFNNLRDHEGRLELTWHRGFLDTATLRADRPGDDDDDDPLTDGELLRRLLRLRSARLLRALHIELDDGDDGDDGDPDEPIDLLADLLDGPPARGLLSFSLGNEPYYDEPEIDDDFYCIDTARDGAAVLGALDRLGDLFPRLEHLALCGRDLDLGAWRFPHLRHAELHFARPEQPTVAAFARAAWPALRSLRLGLGNYPTDAQQADALAVLGPVLTAERMPQLRHLALVHPPDADAVCAVLARVPAAARLETLEISSSGMTTAGAIELAGARRRFPNLRHLDIADNLLTPADERLLQRAFPGVHIHTGPQRTPLDHDLDDEDAESLRLAALGGAPPVPSGLLRTDDDLPDHLDDRYELLLDRIVVDPPTTEHDPRLTPPDPVAIVEPAKPEDN